MKPQSCKSKGRRFQQRIVRTILEAFPHLHEDDCVSTSMGAPGEDVRLSPLARDSLPLSLECKCVERLNVWDCVQQAERNCPPYAQPCLVFSRNRSPAYAVVSWDHLLHLYKTRGDATPDAGNDRTGVSPRVAELVRELYDELQKGAAPSLVETSASPAEE